MQKLVLSRRKARAISNGVLLIGFGILIYTNAWWPWILLVLWAGLALRQYLTERTYDLIISTFVLLGLFLITLFKLDFSVLMPILFVIGGIYIIFREYYFTEEIISEEKSREIKDDIED